MSCAGKLALTMERGCINKNCAVIAFQDKETGYIFFLTMLTAD